MHVVELPQIEESLPFDHGDLDMPLISNEQKLKLAAEKRAATGKRATLKKGLMPTLYTPSDNDSSNLKQITTGSLKSGRPWQ